MNFPERMTLNALLIMQICFEEGCILNLVFVWANMNYFT